MKISSTLVLLAACTIAAGAQAPAASKAKPAGTAPTLTAAPAAKPSSEAKPVIEPIAHITPVAGIHKNLYTVTLSYQDIKVGTGPEALPKKFLKYNYTLWLASDGSELDSTDDHRAPVLDKDRKPVLDQNGKPKLGEPQPAIQMMGTGRPLPGWDLGFQGMKAGGKRRIFIPWQLGLGDREIPARGPSHPAIPAKSDLILDVDLIEVMDTPPARPNMMMPPHPAPGASPRMAPPPASAPHATPAAPAATHAAPVAPPPSK